MAVQTLILKKNEERRILHGHPWIYSNEVDTKLSPLKNFTLGEEVTVLTHDQKVLGSAYVNPHSLITGRIFARDAITTMDVTFFKEKIAQALTFREQIFKAPFYRLVFGEADGLPGLIIDRFGTHFAVQTNTAGMEKKQQEISEALRAVIPETTSILLKNTSSVRKHEGLASITLPLFGEPPQEITLIENDAHFAVPFWEGQKTGWFYDHRNNRAQLQKYVAGKTVLDVFSYLGGWGIEAALFGASHIDCIDASKLACEYIEKNARLNHVDQKVVVQCKDAFDALKELSQAKKQFDVIILDPPAFIKKAKDHKEGMLAYQRLNEMALLCLAPGGVLISCSCSMHLTLENLLQLLNRAAFRASATIQIVERGHQGGDHPIHPHIPETDYLKAVVVRKI